MELQKIPPHDEEAEQAVIGSMLTDQEAVVSAIESLKSEDFYRSDNATIYEAIMSVYAKGEPIDIITVKEELVSMGKLDSVGGLEYLASLPEKVPTTANVEKYVNIVEELKTPKHICTKRPNFPTHMNRKWVFVYDGDKLSININLGVWFLLPYLRHLNCLLRISS